MTVRPPRSLSAGLTGESGWTVLDYEIREQKAHALGTSSRRVEQALAALRALETGAPEPNLSDRRSALLDAAADLVWAFMVQREMCGLRNWDTVVRDYRIPREVLNRVGQTRRKPGVNETS